MARRRPFHTTVAIVVFTLSLCAPAEAQEQSASIEGTVKDAHGGVLHGAAVEASGPSLIRSAVAITDGRGLYRFPVLPPGSYQLTITLAGFDAATQIVELALGQAMVLDTTLTLPGVAERVDVAVARPLIDTRKSATSVSIRGDLVDTVPRGRDFTSLVTIAPGVNSERKLAGLSLDGASGSENEFYIDGMRTTEPRTGQSGKDLLTDFVEEVQVKSSGYDAEFGGATGGVFNVITKSGDSAWRGDIGAYYSGSSLDGSPRSVLRLNPADDGIAEYVTYPRDRYTRWEPAFSLGGPLRRGRAWMFAGYVPTILSTDRTVTFLANGETSGFTSRETTHNLTTSLQIQASSKGHGRFAINVDNLSRDGSLPPLDGTGNPLEPYDTKADVPNAMFSGQLHYAPATTLLFGARIGYLRADHRDRGIPNEIRYVHGRSSIGLAGVPADLQRPFGFSTIPTNSATLRDRFSRLGVNVDGTWYASFAGRHAVKAGLQFEQYGNDVLDGAQQPSVILVWNQAFRAADGRVVRGPYGHYIIGQDRVIGDISSRTLGLFVQDSWVIGDRLTINAGIRGERESIPSYDTTGGSPSSAITFGLGDKLAPRLGVAYDVAGDGRWKLYASWGVFYDITKLEMPRNLFGGSHLVNAAYTLDTPDWPSLNGPSPIEPGFEAQWPGEFIDSFTFLHQLDDPHRRRIDPGLQPFELREVTLGVEHALTARTSIGVRYLRKGVRTAVEDIPVLDPDGDPGDTVFIGNPGLGLAKTPNPTQCNGPCPDQPKARRQYDGVEFRIHRRMADRWLFNASYLYSRLHGNYPGLASSDELTCSGATVTACGTGRASPNILLFADYLYGGFDARGRPVYGRLATDRPHQFKAQTVVDLPSRTALGVNWFIGSGAPFSTEMHQKGFPFFPFGRGDLGRAPTYSQLDVYVQQEFRVGRSSRLQVSLNVLNLLDEDTATFMWTTSFLDTLALPTPVFFAGFDPATVSAGLRPNPGYRQLTGFQEPRRLRLAVKYLF